MFLWCRSWYFSEIRPAWRRGLPPVHSSFLAGELSPDGEKNESKMDFKLIQPWQAWYITLVDLFELQSYQSWSGCVKDDVCGLRQLSLWHLDDLTSGDQSQVVVLCKGIISERTSTPPSRWGKEIRHLWRLLNALYLRPLESKPPNWT